ncbi:unnamed protein product [Echinostoma caproni]|uniref:Uncharacterized protein n=1 Tax=Echinostoma caproni TaxID=27848 RepID=A0A183BFG6_9TREM|nr:unnamed protein product [Echinostoma caproni]
MSFLVAASRVLQVWHPQRDRKRLTSYTKMSEFSSPAKEFPQVFGPFAEVEVKMETALSYEWIPPLMAPENYDVDSLLVTLRRRLVGPKTAFEYREEFNMRQQRHEESLMDYMGSVLFWVGFWLGSVNPEPKMN